MSRLRILMAAACALASASAGSASAQSAHEPFLRRDIPPAAWHFDERDDDRDFQNNGFFPGNFAANPASAWIGAAGLFGFTPSGGSHFAAIYCTRRYRSYNRERGYFQGEDGVWYRCHR
jgi:BA14K-like protein